MATGVEQRRADQDGNGIANGKQHPGGVEQDIHLETGFDRLAHQVAGQAVEAVKDIILGIVRADILGAGKALFQEAVQTGGRLAFRLPAGDCNIRQPQQHDYRDDNEHQQRQADAPVFERQHHQDAHHQQPCCQRPAG